MADTAALVKALLGGGYNSTGAWNRNAMIGDALNTEATQLVQTDPFAMGGLSLSQSQIGYQPQLDWKENLALNLMQSVGGGLLTGYGQRRLKPKLETLKTLSFGGPEEDIYKATEANPDFAKKILSINNQDALNRKLEKDNAVNAKLEAEGIVRDGSGAWSAAPGARETRQQLEGTASPLIASAIYKTRLGQELTPEENMAISTAPLDIQRQVGNIEYRNAIDDRYEDKKSFDSTLNRKLFDKQSEAERFITKKQNIDLALANFDQNETIAGALARNVQGGLMRDSDAADLQRQIKEAAFAALKPTFPGTISDQERKELVSVMGGEMSVPVSTLKKIFDRRESSIIKDVNRDLKRALDAKYQVPLDYLPNPNGENAELGGIQEGAQQSISAGSPPPGLSFDEFRAWKRANGR